MRNRACPRCSGRGARPDCECYSAVSDPSLGVRSPAMDHTADDTKNRRRQVGHDLLEGACRKEDRAPGDRWRCRAVGARAPRMAVDTLEAALRDVGVDSWTQRQRTAAKATC